MQLYANKMGNWEKKNGQILKMYNLPRLNQEEIYEQNNHKFAETMIK